MKADDKLSLLVGIGIIVLVMLSIVIGYFFALPI